MDFTYFEGQEAFLEDYQKVAKAATIDQQQVVDKLFYILPGDKTVKGQAVRFPFRKELIAMDEEATVSTQFFYEGSPYEYEVLEEEQR